jgi:hypothetical protein
LGRGKTLGPGPNHCGYLGHLRDVGKDLPEADYDAIRRRLRKHGLTEKLLDYARRFKAVIDEQPGLVESFCQDVQGHSLPSQKLEVFPLLCAYALTQRSNGLLWP